ncbi:MAG: carboxypeptidase regulatory-like domain-containing protein, partial [Clostridia bacterium]|nr:carboxypeptidase regulatory-like domain-containing protein [Clostridia bacterium]
EGESVLLEVSATANGELSYQWYKDGVAVDGATEASYEATEAGLYKVVVTNTLSGTTAQTESSVAAVTVKAPEGFNVTGTVKAFGDSSANVTIELVSEDTVVATTTVAGNSGTYTFEGVEAGSYVIKVSKSRHALREYAVEVVDADVAQDLLIWLYGDVTGDGVVNNTDVMQINRYNTNNTSVFNQTANSDYRFKVANVTAITGTDKVVNNTDVMQINRYNTNNTSVFDRLA